MTREADPLASVARLPGVFEAVEAARGSVDALLRELRAPAARPRVGEVTAEALRHSAWAAAALSGRIGELENFAAPVSDPFGANALRLYVELAALAETWQVAPMQALARMHVLAASGLLEAAHLGQPASPEAAARLESLAESLSQPTAAPAVVVAAVVHGELLATNSFGPGSGLVALAASRAVLISRGLDPRAASVPERGHLELGAEAYGVALQGYASGTRAGLAEWVGHCAQAIALGGRAGRGIVDEMLKGPAHAGGASIPRSAAADRQSG